VFRPAPKKTEANRDVCEKFLSAYNKLLEFFDDVYAARQRANVNTKDDDTFDFLRKQTGAADKVIRVKKCKSYVTNHSTKEDLEKVKKNYMLVKAMFPEHVFIDGRYAIIDQEFAEMIKAAPDPAQGVRRKSKAYDKQSASESRKTFVDILNSKSISDRLNEELWGERTQSGNNESQIMNYLQLVNLMQVRFYTAKDLFPPLSVVGEDEGDAGVQAPLQRLFAGIDF
jgi:hypothetical protein